MSGRQTDMGFPGATPAAPTRIKPANRTSFRARKLEVTQDDIDKAMRSQSNLCMIAEAIKRQVPGATHVSVDIQSIRFVDTKNDRKVACFTPPNCQKGLFEFDNGRPVTPFTFNLQSVQISARTKTVPKLDADGNPVRREPYTLASGKTIAGGTKRRTVTQSTNKKELVTYTDPTGNERPNKAQIIGGKMPPRHTPSVNRKFGAKHFTFDDGEDMNAAHRRFNAAWGYAPPDELARLDAEATAASPPDEPGAGTSTDSEASE